jgi:hypothetical protein
MEILVQVLSLHCGKQVSPNEWYATPWDSSSLIRNLNRDIFLTFDDDNLDWWIRSLIVGTISFDDGSKGVLEQLEKNVGQMSGDIWEVKVTRTD